MTWVEGKRIAFIGLGAMGSPMAGHLVKAGAHVTVHNRSAAKQASWLAAHPSAAAAASASEAAAQADVVITCVRNDADLSAIYEGPTGALACLREGALVIDHTTASAEIARDLDTGASARQAHFIDAPVSGGSAGAQAGRLSIMAGGTDIAVELARPVLGVYGRTITHMGPVGSGQLAKMVNQICIAGVLEGLAEGLALAVAAGLDTERLLAAMKDGAADSWQMRNRASFMLSEEFPAGFAAELMHKDLSLASSASGRFGLGSPVIELVRICYANLISRGFGEEDFSNLFRAVMHHY
jgi:3-hydroxyisobutyrate dehydrogenase-like beta-hydroxyacid dehydrogenase